MALTPLSARPRRLLPVALVTLAFVAGACGGGGKDEASPKPTTTTKQTTTTTAPPTAPLTGLPQADAGKLTRPALMVKVDNTPKGFVQQQGIDKADIVFVEQTEQGTTRLAAVFQSQDATVGPVRSARTSDVGIAGALNHPMLAYSGANGGVLRQVRSGPLVDVGIDARSVTAIYQRNQRGGSRNLYRYFLPTADIYGARGAEGKTPPPLFHYRAAGQASAGTPANGLRVGYGGGAATVVSYAWDPALKGWARTQSNRVHVMAGGGPRIAPANVVVLVTPYRNSGFRDVTGAVSPQAVLEGGGEAWFLSDGKVVKGRWSRPGPNGAFTFTDGAGAPAALTPGQTFIELAPSVGAASIL
ncbi:MAG: hypothetical protein JWN29_1664 [Acidimicrobiales bacterium]|nr:hypothetical protein [Acidimicrobiales bacterium]